MNIAQTRDVVKHVCAVEGRVPTEETVRSWHELLQHTDYEVANKAALLALSDHQIHQVAPKHILAKVHQAVTELNAVLRKAGMEESGWKSEPQPICKEHGLEILRCDDCCSVLRHQVGHLSGDKLHAWACANLYRADSLVGEGAPF